MSTIQTMSILYYSYNKNGDKISVTGKELQELAKQGVITPDTLVEVEGGKTVWAKGIKGLMFAKTVQSKVPKARVIPEDDEVETRMAQFLAEPVQSKPTPKATDVMDGQSISLAELQRQSAREWQREQELERKALLARQREAEAEARRRKVEADALWRGNAGATEYSPAIDSDSTIKTLNSYFQIFWVGIVLGLPLCFILVGVPIVIIGIIFGCLLQYQLWKVIPAGIARTTPGKAVGLSFIPLFNFYWVFVAFNGLGKDMNKALRRRGMREQVNEGLGLILCILCVICSIFSFFVDETVLILSGILGLVEIVILIFFFKSVKDGAIALLGGEYTPTIEPQANVRKQQQNEEQLTGKQRCGMIGGTFIFIGLVLLFVGNNMNSHNKGLRWEVEDADYLAKDASRQYEIIARLNPYGISERENQAAKTFNDASTKAYSAGKRLAEDSYSQGLIDLLSMGGGFLLLFGFVLTVVGWCIPPEQ